MDGNCTKSSELLVDILDEIVDDCFLSRKCEEDAKTVGKGSWGSEMVRNNLEVINDLLTNGVNRVRGYAGGLSGLAKDAYLFDYACHLINIY